MGLVPRSGSTALRNTVHCRVGASSNTGGGRAPFPALILPHSCHREGKGSEMFLCRAPEHDTDRCYLKDSKQSHT